MVWYNVFGRRVLNYLIMEIKSSVFFMNVLIVRIYYFLDEVFLVSLNIVLEGGL